MANYKQMVMDYFDREGVKYDDTGDRTVRVTYSGDNMKSIPINLIFDKEGDGIVCLRCWTIGNFKDKEAGGILACNQKHNEYRWVSFYIDKDKDLCCQIDAYIYPDTCGETCYNLVQRMVGIIDDCYPDFMRSLWS